METKKFTSIRKNDNLDDVNLKIYQEDNEENSKDKEDKDSIEIIRRQEYLLQMKTEVKFPIYKILQKFKYIQENEEYKLCSKIRIDSSKNCLMKALQNSNEHININIDTNLDISNEIFEEDLISIKNNNKIIDNDSDECQIGYLFIFQDKIILTNNQIENLKKSLKKNPVLYSIKFSQFCIYRIIINDTSQNELYLQFYDDTFTEKKDLMLKFLVTRDSFCVHHFIKKYFILQWQIIFESTIILDYKKLIYNRHYILLKYNRHGKCQERTLLVTNGLLLNIKHDFKKSGLIFSIKNIQWAIGIRAIKKMVLMIETKKENKLRMYLDKMINNSEVIKFLGNTKYLKFKEERNFEFYSVDERNDFVGLMRRNYFLLTNKFIQIDTYPPINKKKIGTKPIIESNIFDSSFESSEEEQKINEKEKEKEQSEKILKQDIKEKVEIGNDNDGGDDKKEIKEDKEKQVNKNENKKEENFNENKINEINISPKKDKEKNNNEIKNDNINNNNDNKKNEKENDIKNKKKDNIKKEDKKIIKKEEKKKDKIKNKNKPNNTQKKGLKKTKKSIFDDDYNNIFDSDYESEEDN